jgi:hypothetical protein
MTLARGIHQGGRTKLYEEMGAGRVQSTIIGKRRILVPAAGDGSLKHGLLALFRHVSPPAWRRSCPRGPQGRFQPINQARTKTNLASRDQFQPSLSRHGTPPTR